MNKELENYIEHEVKIRLQELRHNELKNNINEAKQELKNNFLESKYDFKGTIGELKETMRHMDLKMDSQFKWIIGSIVGLFCGTFLPLFGGIILHMAKLI